MTLSELNPHTYYNLLQLNYLQKTLHQSSLPTQKYTLTMYIPQDCLICPHMSIHQKHLPHFLFLNQISNLPVDIHQAYHLLSCMITLWCSLSQLHHLHQFTIPVDIRTHSHQYKHKINTFKLYPQHKIPHISHHRYFRLLLMLTLLYPVTFQVLFLVSFQVLITQI